MKRYVKEFINSQIAVCEDVIAFNKLSGAKADYASKIERLKKILAYCEKRMITDFEAVKVAVEIMEEGKA